MTHVSPSAPLPIIPLPEGGKKVERLKTYAKNHHDRISNCELGKTATGGIIYSDFTVTLEAIVFLLQAVQSNEERER